MPLYLSYIPIFDPAAMPEPPAHENDVAMMRSGGSRTPHPGRWQEEDWLHGLPPAGLICFGAATRPWVEGGVEREHVFGILRCG